MTNVARPSVASLILQPQVNGLTLGVATGFVVVEGSSHFLITNRHVVRGRDNNASGASLHPSGAWPDTIVIMHHVANQLGSWQPRLEPLYDALGTPLWLEHPVYRGAVDVIALPLTNTIGCDFYPHDPRGCGVSLAVGVTRSLFIVGFPFGVTGGGALGVWVQGTVATEIEMDWGELPTFLIDSRTRQGQSGSPVIAFHSGGAAAMEDGSTSVGLSQAERFMGVYSGRINAESDLGIVWKRSVVVEILDGGVPGSG
ncbi:MAG: trypsin-like peptidase domain-containing protein [Acidimicrobiales bacterium]